VSLHYLKNKEKHEVDFLAVIDGKPELMIEVKVSDDNFSRSLFLFQKFLKRTKSIQIVYNLDRKKSSKGVKMLPVHDFLTDINLSPSEELKSYPQY
jgi:predicted AAA+ superfamily ATPase